MALSSYSSEFVPGQSFRETIENQKWGQMAQDLAESQQKQHPQQTLRNQAAEEPVNKLNKKKTKHFLGKNLLNKISSGGTKKRRSGSRKYKSRRRSRKSKRRTTRRSKKHN